MPVEAREQVCAPRPFRSGIGLARSPRRGPNGPIPDRNPEVAGVKSEDLKASLEPECKLHRCACSKQRRNGQA